MSSLTPAKIAPKVVNSKEKQSMRSGKIEFIIHAISTVVSIEQRRKVRKLTKRRFCYIIKIAYSGMLTNFTENSPKSTVIKFVRPIRKPREVLVRTSLRVETRMPMLSKNLKLSGFICLYAIIAVQIATLQRH